ncbi:MAG TPA: site-specific integrase [Pyrinomonadaceae bacterium]|jgi:integrase
MPSNATALVPQKATRKNSGAVIRVPEQIPDTVSWWAEQYFQFEVTTSSSSRKVQQRDLGLFVEYMNVVEKTDRRINWSPRLSKAFQEYLKNAVIDGKRHWSDRSINRIMAHLKTFARWIHKLRAFPLGNPMEKIKLQALGTGLEVERALTPAERRKVLDAADLLVEIGGRSRDRSRYRGTERPKRKGYRALRNRAIIYTLIETGMRRAAAIKVDVDDIDFKKKTVTVEEKGRVSHSYQISNEGLQAIKDYLERERPQDNEKWRSPALFLSPSTNPNGNGRLTVKVINDVWNEVAEIAGVEGKTPHSARHAMGKHIMEKTGNIAAIQRQLGHKNAAYSMQYSRITADELRDVINDR